MTRYFNIYLITGALFERPVRGGEVGPTNGRIIADQFKRLKYGDRFFFNHRTSGHGRGLGQVAARNIIRSFSIQFHDFH
jgi:hypothetical protein